MTRAVGAVLRVVHADDDGLGGHVEPLVGHAGAGGLVGGEGKVGPRRVGRHAAAGGGLDDAAV